MFLKVENDGLLMSEKPFTPETIISACYKRVNVLPAKR